MTRAPYALCADLHCHAWSQFATTTPAGLNSRLEAIIVELHRLAKTAAARGCRRVYVAGDVFHVRGAVKPSVLNPVIQALREIVGTCGLEFRIMPGNHDLEGRECEWLGSAIAALGEIEGVTVIDRPTVFADDLVVMVPWQQTREGLAEVLVDQASTLGYPQEYDLVLHTGINGVLMGVPDHGWYPDELLEFGFARVFSGHYHAHKTFERDRVVSIGALTHQTWSDVGTHAGFLIVGDGEFEFHESAAPKFIDYDPGLPGTGYAGNYVRVKGVELEEDEIRALRGEIEALGAAGVVIHAVPKSKVVTRQGAVPGTAVTLEDSITGWIGGAGIADAAAVAKLALEILTEARAAPGGVE